MLPCANRGFRTTTGRPVQAGVDLRPLRATVPTAPSLRQVLPGSLQDRAASKRQVGILLRSMFERSQSQKHGHPGGDNLHYPLSRTRSSTVRAGDS